jgi:nitrate reductase gamma subunit
VSDSHLFAVAPVAAFVMLAVAATLRLLYDDSLRARPSRLLRAVRRTSLRHPLPAVGFAGVLLAHVVMVALPDQLLAWNRDFFRLITFESVHFALGAAATLGVAIAFWRRVLRRHVSGGLFDVAFLSVLLLTLSSGLAVALLYRWAAAWSVATVTPYVRSVLRLQPDVGPLEAMPYLVKLHIFSSFIVIALVAFTRNIDVLLTIVRRALAVAMRPFVSVVDIQRRRLQAWALRGGHLLWPEEED